MKAEKIIVEIGREILTYLKNNKPHHLYPYFDIKHDCISEDVKNTLVEFLYIEEVRDIFLAEQGSVVKSIVRTMRWGGEEDKESLSLTFEYARTLKKWIEECDVIINDYNIPL